MPLLITFVIKSLTLIYFDTLSFLFIFKHLLHAQLSVAYFDQQTGARYVVCWSKSFVSALKQVFPSFYITNGKRQKIERKAQNLSQELTSFWVSTSISFSSGFLVIVCTFLSIFFIFFCLCWKKM